MEKEVEELKMYFKSINLPKTPFLLSQGETIGNVEIFLESHFETLKNRKSESANLPFLLRLRKLKSLLANQTNV